MNRLRVLLGAFVLVVATVVQGAAQNPDNGVAADDINIEVENSILDTLRTTQAQQWELHQSTRLSPARVEHEFHSMIGVRLRRLTTKVEYMVSESDADKCVDFLALTTSKGGTPLSGVGDEAYIWTSQGYASVTFREGSVVAVVRFIDPETTDDLGPTVIDFAEDVAVGIANGQ
jgi:hypothetical protein